MEPGSGMEPKEDASASASAATAAEPDDDGGAPAAREGDEEGDGGGGDALRDRARRRLCAAQWCAEMSDMIGQFCVYAWLDAAGGGAGLFLAAAYQLTSQVLVLFAVPRLAACAGRRRGRFMARVVAGQNSCVVAMALCFAWVLRHPSATVGHGDGDGDGGDGTALGGSDEGSAAVRGPLWTVAMAAAFLLGGVGEVLRQSYMVVIERDWVVAMADSDEVWLRQTTVFLKQIRLVCVILAPILTGQIVDVGIAGGSLGVEWLIGVKLISLAVEYRCLGEAHRMSPTLHADGDISIENADMAPDLDRAEDFAAEASNPGKAEKCRALRSYRDDLRVYASQSMVWAGLGYALLYLDVLTFGGMMTTFLKSRGIPWSTIGVLQGASNLVGLLGTCAFSLSRRCMALESTALWGVWWQFACLTVAVSSVLADDWDDDGGSNDGDGVDNGGSWSLAACLIIAGVIPSRIGLWVHSVSITQLFQNTVPPAVRGRVGGTQTSINSCAELALFVLCMAFPAARDFRILMLVGYAAVGGAATLFLVRVYLPYRRSATYAPAGRSEHELAGVELPEMS